MLCSGPWAQSLVAFGPGTSAEFERFFVTLCGSSAQSEQRFGKLPALGPPTGKLAGALRGTALPQICRPDGAIGVNVDGQIKAVAIYRISGTAASNRNMHLLIGVAKDYRRTGMATALLMRITTIARRAGSRYLVLEDVDVGVLKLAQRASADLVFCNGECQGWIELAPVQPTYASMECPDMRQTS